jgi:hypothetical protein
LRTAYRILFSVLYGKKPLEGEDGRIILLDLKGMGFKELR